MTNFGALAIMATLPPTAPPRQLRLLLAIETFPADRAGWRSIGSETLMEQAHISYPTYKAARTEVIDAGLAEYVPGNGSGKGKGTYSRWRLLIDLTRQEDRVTTFEDAKGGNGTPRKGGNPDPVKVVTQNAPTCEDASTALGSTALESSALSRGPAADMIRAAVPGVTDDEIEAFIAKITPNCRSGDIARYLAAFGASDIAAQITAMRTERKRAKQEADKADIAAFRSWTRVSTQPACEHGQPGGDQADPAGTVLCPLCRREQETSS